MINAQSIPKSSWSCTDWMTWHKALKKYFMPYISLDQVNHIWTAAWEREFFAGRRFCAFTDTDVVEYFDRQGINISNMLVRSITEVAATAKELGSGLLSTLKISGKLLPFIVIFIVGVAGIVIWRVSKDITKGDLTKLIRTK